MWNDGAMEKEYLSKVVHIRMSDKQHSMFSILTDILNEDRSKIIRRLLMAEAKRASAFIEGEELELWISLLEEIESEEEMQTFIRGEAISTGRARAYKEKTGKDFDVITERIINRQAEKNYAAVKKWRAKRKLQELKKDGWFNERKIMERNNREKEL